jgi:peroxiredoxin
MRISGIVAAVVIAVSGFVHGQAPGPQIAVGAMAPAFSVLDDRDQTRSLDEFKGKYLVIEWHEKGCPYVSKHYKTGHMQKLQQAWMARGVEWLLVTSSAEGNHSYLTADESRAYMKEIGATPTAHLLDVKGVMGRRYGVTTALHMVIVDPTGTVAYNGAIDDKPTQMAADLVTATNYVQSALTALLAGGSANPSKTVPYGCAVHYSGGQ